MFEVGDRITSNSVLKYEWIVKEVQTNPTKYYLTTVTDSNGTELPYNERHSIGWCAHQNDFRLVTENVEAAPFALETPNVTVYVAYTRHRNTGTNVPVSATTEEKLNTMLRACEREGFVVLARKKIKFTI